MTQIPSQTAHDYDIDAFISSIDPKTMRDAKHLRAISAARTALGRAEGQLVDAVRAARSAGDSWTAIGIALRTSKQNAHRKFANLVGEPEEEAPATAPDHAANAATRAYLDAAAINIKLINGADMPTVDDNLEEVNMTKDNERHVVPGKDGGWDVVKPNSTRSSSHHDTQSGAIDRGRDIIRNAGGGELNIHGRNGAIRAKDTIPNGNDPRSSKG